MRDKIRDRSSTTINQVNSLNFVPAQSPRATEKTWMARLVMSLGLAGGLWFTTATHIPQIAQAQTVSFDVTINRRPNETYENLVKRAEAVARAAISNNLTRNQQAKDVSVTVVAHNGGAIAPVLNLKVSRSQQYNPNADSGITYFNQARSLLRLDEDLATTPANTPAGRTNNTNSRSGVQPRITNPTTPSSSQNTTPGTARQGFGGSSSFSQPARTVTPSTTTQPTNTAPSGSTGTANPSIPTGQTSPTGTGLTPQSPSSTPINSPSQPLNSTPSSGTGLAPQTPSTGQPLLTPSSPNSTNTNSNNSGTSTTAPGIVPSSQPR
ncbi:MAG TPA: hypothetical protein DEV81_05605 [Cyanobacteria bacterium UBA11049]|nr:hypothetical protein [Cyanobacteria bacterium UBA11049]